MPIDPYLYPDTHILVNLLDIRDHAELARIEADVVWHRFSAAIDTPVPGLLDLDHLKAIHKHLFELIYPFAGKFRTIDIVKAGEIRYASAEHLESNGNAILTAFHKNHQLQNLAKEQLVPIAADLMGDLHVLHPFREGNTRTLQIFISAVAKQAGHEIRWRTVNPETLRTAGTQAAVGEPIEYRRILAGALHPLATKQREQQDEIRELLETAIQQRDGNTIRKIATTICNLPMPIETAARFEKLAPANLLDATALTNLFCNSPKYASVDKYLKSLEQQMKQTRDDDRGFSR